VFFTGRETPTQKQKSLDAFMNKESRVCIMSLRSGTGVDGLQKICNQVVIGALDWSPGVLDQCIGRLHRDGQEQPVFVYYLTALQGCDPTMVKVLGLKIPQLRDVLELGHENVLVPVGVDPAHVKQLARDYLARK
jgi:hypothetical protein